MPEPPDSSSKEKKETFGEDSHVKLTRKEHDKLCDDIGKARVSELIEELNDYIGSKGDKYKSHYSAIKSWHRRKGNEKPTSRKHSKLSFEGEGKDTGWKRPKAEDVL